MRNIQKHTTHHEHTIDADVLPESWLNGTSRVVHKIQTLSETTLLEYGHHITVTNGIIVVTGVLLLLVLVLLWLRSSSRRYLKNERSICLECENCKPHAEFPCINHRCTQHHRCMKKYYTDKTK
jgi:hypothetical protein